MTGCDSVSHLLSYIAAFAMHCKLQGGGGYSPDESLRQPELPTSALNLFYSFAKRKKNVWNDATGLAWGLWALDILQLMKHAWDCRELRVIKHLQGCFIPLRTTTRSACTFHLCNLVKTAEPAQSWWSVPPSGALGVALLMNSDAAITESYKAHVGCLIIWKC